MVKTEASESCVFDATNAATRVDVFTELSDQAAAALRAFCRRLGVPHMFDEAILPMLNEGDSHVVVGVRDRPWPPWGLGGRYVTALCHVHQIGDETYSLSPVYVTDDDLTNLGLICTVFKEALELLTHNPRAEIAYLVVEGSKYAHHVLTKLGFRKSDDIFLTESARYFTYRSPAVRFWKELGMDRIPSPDLIAHEIPPPIMEKNALFHAVTYLGSRAEWARDGRLSEVLRLPRGGHAGKPGGTPNGTGRFAHLPERGDPVFVPFENFLTAAELDQLMQFTLAQEQRFEPSSIVDRSTQMPVINQRVRSSKTLDQVGQFGRLFTERLKERLAPILEKLKYPGFKLGEIELQITASNDGDFYRLHPDSDGTSTRELSFVYFFFREPQPFSGGEFRIFETQLVGNRQVPVDRHHTLVPRRNTLIVFPSRHEHELLPVRVPSKEFADSRFTVNGWIHHG